MRYGLELAAAGTCDARTLGELAALAEESGWDGVFLEDYVVHWSAPDAPTYDPWVALAAIALATRRIRIGTAVTALSRRRPWKVARETVTLDHLSNGRLILGAGLGDRKDGGFARVAESVEDRVRAARLDEALEILVGLWSGEPFSFDGEHFQVREATFLPRQVQQPRIPIWIGGQWPRPGPTARAARWDGFVRHKVHGPDEPWLLTPGDVRELRAFAEPRRRDPSIPFDVALTAGAYDDEGERRDAIAALDEAGATWWVEYVPPGDVDEMRREIAAGPRPA